MLRALGLLWLAGICLRITVLAIPPVIPQIHDSFALSQAAIGALTSLPVLLFSFAAIPGSLLVSRLGPVAVLIGGIFLTGIAGALRGGASDASALFVATFLMGVGIAVMQPALPAIVRDWVPRKVALGTATYSNGLLVGEAISASLTIPWLLPVFDGNWRPAVAAWSLPVLAIGVLVWWRRPRAGTPHRVASGARLWWPDWRDPLTWRLGLLSGYASSLYFCNNAFLPDYLAARGQAGLLNAALSALNWVQMPASLLMLMYAHRLTLKRWPFLVLQATSIVALLGLLAMDDAWIIVWAGVIGFCNAFLLILTLALPPMLSKPDDVHRLSAAMIAIGYLVAFLMPIVGGAVWDASRVATLAYLPLLAYAAVAMALAARLRFATAG
jgi:CP family cyanate transporter-like MFS transporter